jgi:L-fucose isomerase-like protein
VQGIQVGGAQPTFFAIEGQRSLLQRVFNLRVEAIDAGVFRDNLTTGLENEPSWLNDVLKWISQYIDYSQIQDEYSDVPKLTALALGQILQLLVEKQSNCISINCWIELQEILRFMVCGVNGLLYQLGIMAPCETDWPGCLASALLQGLDIGGDPDKNIGCFADLTRFEISESRIMWWHCGPFAPKLACGECVAKPGWIIPTTNGCAGLLHQNWGVIGQPATMAQLRPGNEGLTLVATNGTIIEGPETIGSRFWTQVANPRKYEKWVSENPVDHHHSVMHGLDLLPVMSDVANWLGLYVATYNNIHPENNKD